MGAIDWAILTPIADEWFAVCSKLDGAQPAAEGTTLPAKTGRIGSHNVVCVLAGKGESKTTSAVHYVVQTWKVRWIILAGIAGGFPDQKVRLGDVVVSQFVYNFDFGKLKDGKFVRRPEYDYSGDHSLLAYAELVSRREGSPWTNGINAKRPDGNANTTSHALLGYFASSDKVVDDADHPFYKTVRDTIAEIHAVEMEGSGLGSAVHFEQSRGALGFLMVRGISDEPHTSTALPTPVIAPEVPGGTLQRETWKNYASHAAAAFVESLLQEIPVQKVPTTPAKIESTWTTPLPLEVRLEVLQHWDYQNVGVLSFTIFNRSNVPIEIDRLELETLRQWDLPELHMTNTSRPVIQYLRPEMDTALIKVSEKVNTVSAFHLGFTLGTYKTLKAFVMTDHAPFDARTFMVVAKGAFPFLIQPTFWGGQNQYFRTARILLSLNSHVPFSEYPRKSTQSERQVLEQTAQDVLDNIGDETLYDVDLFDVIVDASKGTPWKKLEQKS